MKKESIEDFLEDEAMERYYDAKEMEEEAILDDDMIYEEEIYDEEDEEWKLKDTNVKTVNV